jgi:hypothetical protein
VVLHVTLEGVAPVIAAVGALLTTVTTLAFQIVNFFDQRKLKLDAARREAKLDKLHTVVRDAISQQRAQNADMASKPS